MIKEYTRLHDSIIDNIGKWLQVELDSYVNRVGRIAITDLLFETNNILVSWALFGGFELKNSKGKIAKRIANNVYKQMGVRLSSEVISQVGNLANINATPKGLYNVSISDDMDTFNPYYTEGDSTSCFGPNGMYHEHWLGMDDNPDCYCLRIEHEGKKTRAWLELFGDCLVIFNAYGELTSTQCGIVLSTLYGVTNTLNMTRVHFDTDVHLNTIKVLAIGDIGENDYITSNTECTGRPCYSCGDYVHEDYSFYSELTCEIYCEHCYHDEFTSCEECNEECYADNVTYVESLSSCLCESCANELTITCEDCYEVIDRDYGYVSDCGNEYCEDCYHAKYTICDSCGNEVSNEDYDSDCEMCDDCKEHESNQVPDNQIQLPRIISKPDVILNVRFDDNFAIKDVNVLVDLCPDSRFTFHVNGKYINLLFNGTLITYVSTSDTHALLTLSNAISDRIMLLMGGTKNDYNFQ